MLLSEHNTKRLQRPRWSHRTEIQNKMAITRELVWYLARHQASMVTIGLFISFSTMCILVADGAGGIPHGGLCNVSQPQCNETTTSCRLSKDGNDRCLCSNSNYYFQPTTGKCSNLNDLKVTVTSATPTTDSVTFTWTANKMGTSVFYTIDLGSSGGKLDYANATGGRVSSLTPGGSYHFTVISVLPADAYYDEKRINSSSQNIQTNRLNHGEICNKPGDSDVCLDQNAFCIQTSPPNDYRCLCGSSYYRGSDNTCRNLDELKVTVSSYTTTTTRVTFSWTANNRGMPVSYRINTWSSGGNVVYASASGGRVSGLTPGESYRFDIESVLPAGNYYAERTYPVLVSFLTKSVYGATCNPSQSVCEDLNVLCINTTASNGSRCLCSDDYFRTPTNICLAMSDLQVSVMSTASTSNNVTFNWKSDEMGVPVTYLIQSNPSGGKQVYANATGGQVSNLRPETNYTFIISSILQASGYYDRKETFFSTDLIQTEIGLPAATNSDDLPLKIGLGVGVPVVVIIIAIIVSLAIVRSKRRKSNLRSKPNNDYDAANARNARELDSHYYEEFPGGLDQTSGKLEVASPSNYYANLGSATTEVDNEDARYSNLPSPQPDVNSHVYVNI